MIVILHHCEIWSSTKKSELFGLDAVERLAHSPWFDRIVEIGSAEKIRPRIKWG